jgi:predicted molibdopterin-dependent oxidoreductase YjgC
MGACQECVVEVDGSLMEACRTPVRDGMVVTQAE